jgi:transcriptional regulator with XRE-family HTH domain
MRKTIFIGDRLKALREIKGLTQRQIVTLTGIHQSTLSQFEGNTREPALDNLIKLALALDTTTDYLCGITERKGHIIPR